MSQEKWNSKTEKFENDSLNIIQLEKEINKHMKNEMDATKIDFSKSKNSINNLFNYRIKKYQNFLNIYKKQLLKRDRPLTRKRIIQNEKAIKLLKQYLFLMK